jgi:hypothetical protein
MPRPPIEPRLLPKQQAAEYCGMSLPTFERLCPVHPVDLRLRRHLYDRKALDQWIDGLNPNLPPAKDWLGAFDDDGHRNAHQRT